MEFTLKFATDTSKVESRGQAVLVELAKLSPEMAQNLFLHGLKQKIADAASAATQLAAEDHFGKARADVPKADWDAYLKTDAAERKIGEQTLAMMQKAAGALYRGEWQIREGTGTRTPTDPVTKLAHDTAKAVLLAGFKSATGKAKLAEIAAAHAKIGEFFATKGDGDKAKTQWNEERVAAWITSQAESGARDFRAEAEASLNGAAKAVDLSDLGL